VRLHRAGTKQFHHPVVGDLDLTFEAMDLLAQSGPSPTAPNPDRASEDGLKLMANWSATNQKLDQAETTHATQRLTRRHQDLAP
jgi:hypothetical protein